MTIAATHDELMGRKPARSRFGIGIEWGVALLLTGAAILFHVRYFLKAGGLWRDEVTSVNLAGRHSLGYALANLHNDSFPALWFCVVRIWVKSGIGATDRGMRGLGLLAGVGILAALWRNARRFGASTPVVSVALVSFTSAVICYGDSVRAYGLGMLLGLCAIGVMWDFAERPSVRRFAVALGVALLSVHVLFYNCVLLLAACCGAGVVTFLRRDRRATGLVFLIGILCAVSMLVYVPMIERTRGEMMFQTRVDFSWMMARLTDSLRFAGGPGGTPGHDDWIWGGALAGSILVAGAAWWAGILESGSGRRREAMLFCGTCLGVGILAYWGFLKTLRYSMQPWYFLAGMGMVATCLDGLFGAVRWAGFRMMIVMGAVGFAVYSGFFVWRDAGMRRTNADLVAAEVGERAVKGDVIIFAPWYVGVSFERYYHGEAECMAIPPVSFLEYQEYDLLLRFLRDRGAMEPVMGKLSGVLRSGHRVWVVSSETLPTEAPTVFFQEAPDARDGWKAGKYESSWDRQVLWFLERNSKVFSMIRMPEDGRVSHFELLRLFRVEGMGSEAGGAG